MVLSKRQRYLLLENQAINTAPHGAFFIESSDKEELILHAYFYTNQSEQ
jgi:hypothetical protein